MNRSRRKFLKAGAVAALAAGIPLAIVNAAPGRLSQPLRRMNWPGAKGGREDVYSLSTFTPHVETAFSAKPGINRVQLTLVEASDLNPASEKAAYGQGECFSLKFAVPSHQQFPQGIHNLEHPALGQFSLFLSPVDRPAQFIIYEAVINRTQG